MEDSKAGAENKREELVYDSSAYEMLHRANLDWPCLSLDFILSDRDNLNFPMHNPYAAVPEGQSVDYHNEATSETTQRHKEDKYPYTVYLLQERKQKKPLRIDFTHEMEQHVQDTA